MTFPELLSLLAERRGVNAVELADRVGVDASYIRRLMAGSRIPVRVGPELIDRIADALGLPAQQRANLHEKFLEARDQRKSDQQLQQDFFDEAVSRILSPNRREAASGILSRRIVRNLTSEYAICKNLAEIGDLFSNNASKEVFVYLAEGVADPADRSQFLEKALRHCGEIKHFTPRIEQRNLFFEVIETVFKIVSIGDSTVKNYHPVILALPGVPSFIASEDRVVFILSHCDVGVKVSISLTDSQVCRLACTMLRRLHKSGTEFVEFFDETKSEFQEKLFDIELTSSVRRGVFDEGLSFITHPPHWYSDNSDFEQHAPWGAWPAPARRVYRTRLNERINHAMKFLDTEEIVSEESLSAYILGTSHKGDFYKDPFPYSLIEEHIHNVVHLLKSETTRYRLYITSGEGLFIRNKSWAAYNDFAFLDKVEGGHNLAVIFSSSEVASGFREIFELAKRKATKKFISLDATADWLLARLSERRMSNGR